MAPTSERTAPTKKSLRIWVRNNGHVMRKKTRVSYVYPRTVEAAKDPFECTTGKNKMFYLIAINLYPDSKIIRPDDSDSETEVDETTQIQNDMDCNVEEMETSSKVLQINIGQVERKQKPITRTRRLPVTERIIESDSESLGSDNCSSESNQHKQTYRKKITTITSSVSSRTSCQRQRLLPVKKTGLKMGNVSAENYEECSKLTGCENCLSSSAEPVEQAVSKNKIKANETTTKGAAILNARKLPAIPTIMNSLNKIIENCSANGVVSFSLPKKKPRQSRS